MIHRHIKEGFEDTIEAIDDILDRGSVEDWKSLAKKIENDPYGDASQAVEIVIKNHYMYGTCIIWDMLLKKYRAAKKTNSSNPNLMTRPPIP
jgi:hypothetical protein